MFLKLNKDDLLRGCTNFENPTVNDFPLLFRRGQHTDYYKDARRIVYKSPNDKVVILKSQTGA